LKSFKSLKPLHVTEGTAVQIVEAEPTGFSRFIRACALKRYGAQARGFAVKKPSQAHS
jgi:hypothetical protein